MNFLSRRAQAALKAPLVLAAFMMLAMVLAAQSSAFANTPSDPSLALCAKAGTVERWNARVR